MKALSKVGQVLQHTGDGAESMLMGGSEWVKKWGKSWQLDGQGTYFLLYSGATCMKGMEQDVTAELQPLCGC